MSAILQALREKLDKLKPKEQQIARYILEHSDEVQHMGITRLAEEAQTSAATITRFCRTLHFSGYPQFKVKLAAELAREPRSLRYQDIVAGNSIRRIARAIESNHIRSISDTTRLLDDDELERAVNALRSAKRIDLYGMATSGAVAYDFYQKLVRVGLQATAFTDPHMQITSAANLSDGDVAFAISYSGETPETIDALKCAKERGATTVSLTKYGANTLAGLADIKLFVSSLEEGMRRGDMASRIALLHVIDILFTGLVSLQFDEFVPRLERTYQLVRKYRKDKDR